MKFKKKFLLLLDMVTILRKVLNWVVLFWYYELTFMFFKDLWFRSILMYGVGSDPMTLQVILYNFPATKYPHSRSMRACVGATEKM